MQTNIVLENRTGAGTTLATFQNIAKKAKNEIMTTEHIIKEMIRLQKQYKEERKNNKPLKKQFKFWIYSATIYFPEWFTSYFG